MKEIAVLFVIALVTCLAINLSSIIITYYSIKADLSEIKDIVLRESLLKSLRSITSVFFHKFLYHTDGDFFKNSSDYKRYIITQNIEDIRSTGLLECKKEQIRYVVDQEDS